MCNSNFTNKIHNLHHLWLLLTGTWYSWESVYDSFFFHSIIQEWNGFQTLKKKCPLQQSTVTGHSFKQKTLLHSIAFPLTLIDEQRHNIDAKLEEKTLYFVSPGKLPNFSQVCSQWKAVQMHVSTTKPSEGLCILISFFTYVGKLKFLSCK